MRLLRRMLDRVAPAFEADGNYSGRVAARAFVDAQSRHVEFNFDEDHATHGFVLSDALTQFMMEEEELQSGAVGLSLVLTRAGQGDEETLRLLALLRSAADQGKIVLRAVGLVGAADLPSEGRSSHRGLPPGPTAARGDAGEPGRGGGTA